MNGIIATGLESSEQTTPSRQPDILQKVYQGVRQTHADGFFKKKTMVIKSYALAERQNRTTPVRSVSPGLPTQVSPAAKRTPEAPATSCPTIIAPCPGSFPAPIPDRMEVDGTQGATSSNPTENSRHDKQTPTRKSRFKEPSHGTGASCTENTDPEFSLMESPEAKSPPKFVAKPPEILRKELLDFFDDNSFDIGVRDYPEFGQGQVPTEAGKSEPATLISRSPVRSCSSSPPPSPSSSSSPGSSRSASPLPPQADELDIPSFPALKISLGKDDDLACAAQLQVETEEEAERERHRRAEEERRIQAAKKRKREAEEALARTGGLRLPNLRVVGPITEEWRRRIESTLQARESTGLAKSAEGTDITGRDFRQVVPPTVWLNDEIINGSLSHLAKFINQSAGIKDTKTQTAKCLLLNSYFWAQLKDRGTANTQRWLRRLGVREDNFLNVDTFLIPINLGNSHWTLGVVRPKQGIVAHMDSLGPHGAGNPIIAEKLMEWIRVFLRERFVPGHWTIRNYTSPGQTNSWDCGVHSITNGMCIALGIDPSSYQPSDMPLQRLRIAGVLLNGGFTGDFDLSPL